MMHNLDAKFDHCGMAWLFSQQTLIYFSWLSNGENTCLKSFAVSSAQYILVREQVPETKFFSALNQTSNRFKISRTRLFFIFLQNLVISDDLPKFCSTPLRKNNQLWTKIRVQTKIRKEIKLCSTCYKTISCTFRHTKTHVLGDRSVTIYIVQYYVKKACCVYT